MSVHLAVDGGNSKTVAVAVDDEGVILGRGRTGGSDLYSSSDPDAAVSAICEAATQALREASAERVGGAAFRLAGVDWPEDADWLTERIVARLPPIESLTLGNDALASLRLGNVDGIGVAITVGTGPAIGARSASGAEAWSGMWVFDEMGGHSLAETGVAAVCRAWMGLAPPTALTDALLEFFGEPDVRSLRHSLTRRFGARPRQDLVRAARVVLRVADQGDPVALAIVARQADALVDHATWVAGQVGIGVSDQVQIVLNGSVATSEYPVLREALVDRLAVRFPACRPVVATASPIAGCVLDALAVAGVPLHSELQQRVCTASHPAQFLAT